MHPLARIKSIFAGETQTFNLLVLGQLISSFGSRMSSFGLGVWIYEATGSKTQFGFSLFLQFLPVLAVSLFGGPLIDRFNRRNVLILSDLGSALGNILVLALALAGLLQIWHVYLMILLGSAFGAIHGPAFAAVVPQLVKKEALGRANGLLSTGNSIGQIVGPAVAAVLLARFQLAGLVAVDLVTFLFNALVLLTLHIPAVERTGPAQQRHWISDALYGATYLRAHPGLPALLIFQLCQMFLVQMSLVVYNPMILDFTTAEMLGLIVSIGGIGGVAGGLVMSIWGGPQRRGRAILAVVLLIGVGLVINGLRPSVLLVAIGTTFLLFLTPFHEGSRMALWQSKVAPDVQGRVFALNQMCISLVVMTAYMLSGPITERFFEPLLVAGGPLADTLVGLVIGTGKGRGAALFTIVLGISLMAVTAGAWFHRRLREVDQVVPDAI